MGSQSAYYKGIFLELSEIVCYNKTKPKKYLKKKNIIK